MERLYIIQNTESVVNVSDQKQKFDINPCIT